MRRGQDTLLHRSTRRAYANLTPGLPLKLRLRIGAKKKMVNVSHPTACGKI